MSKRLDDISRRLYVAEEKTSKTYTFLRNKYPDFLHEHKSNNFGKIKKKNKKDKKKT